ELALCGCVVNGEWYYTPVSKPDAPALTFLAAWFLHHHRRCPVHVIERQPRIHERPLPGRPLVAGLVVGIGALYGLGHIGLGRAELDATIAALIARKPLLQGSLHRALQLRADGRAHGVGIGGDRIDAGCRPGFARDLIDEMEADLAPWPLVGHEFRQRRQL